MKRKTSIAFISKQNLGSLLTFGDL